MITSIEISNLRGIRTGKLQGLTPVTVFVGGNGSGKSTVLEAIGLSLASEPEMVFNLLGNREWLGLEGVKAWFNNDPYVAQIDAQVGSGDTARRRVVRLSLAGSFRASEIAALGEAGVREKHLAIELSVEQFIYGSEQWRLVVDSDGRMAMSTLESGTRDHRVDVPLGAVASRPERGAGARAHLEEAVFVSSDRYALDAAKRSGTYKALVSYLKLLKPKLASIESLGIGVRSEPHVFEEDPHTVYPLAYAGEGFREALAIAAALGEAKGGVCTIDEPESHGHPSLFRSIVAMTRAAVRDETQVFFSTHSLDFIRALGAEFEKTPELWSIVALHLEKGELFGQHTSGARAAERLFDLGDDVRL